MKREHNELEPTIKEISETLMRLDNALVWYEDSSIRTIPGFSFGVCRVCNRTTDIIFEECFSCRARPRLPMEFWLAVVVIVSLVAWPALARWIGP